MFVAKCLMQAKPRFQLYKLHTSSIAGCHVVHPTTILYDGLEKKVTSRNVRALELHRLFAKHSSVTCIIARNGQTDVALACGKVKNEA